MSTNYNVSGTDLDDVFQIYYTNQASATGFSVNGSDLNTFFEKIGGGTTSSTTNYKANNDDLNTLFSGKTYTIIGDGTYAEVANTDSTKYIVICFGSTTSINGSSNSIVFNTATTVNYWVVGGGGGGGGTQSGTARAAGGGAGGSIVTGSINVDANVSYSLVYGEGGAGKANNLDGIDGDASYIFETFDVPTNYVAYAAGGYGGKCGANDGDGGAAASYNGTANIGKGGNGAYSSAAATDGNDGKNMATVESITLTNYGPRYSGGGGGGGTSVAGYTTGGTGGGSGIGGDGGDYSDSGNLAQNGTNMTGSGGGGAAKTYIGDSYRQGGDGGSGAVFLWFTYY